MAGSHSVKSEKLEENEGELGGPMFSPPLYRQRYDVVCDIVRKMEARKVVDMGCASGKLLWHLKWIDCIEELAGVDVDVTQLQGNSHILCPLTTDYLMPRKKPLNICLFEGSIGSADSRLYDWDIVCCVEVIEHLHTGTLALVPHALFHQLQPKVVIVTTPNSEFNILFSNFRDFRHWDHKFEWTRDEFRSWADGIASEFNYSVEYSGVGEGPPGSLDKLGWCTQIAVFTRLHIDSECAQCIEENLQPYRCIKEISHPHQLQTPHTTLQQLNDELTYYCHFLADIDCGTETDEEDAERVTHTVCIRLERLMKFGRIKELCPDLDELRSCIRQTEQFHLSPDGDSVLYTHILMSSSNGWNVDDDDGGESDVVDDYQVDNERRVENWNQTITTSPKETTETWD